MMNRAGDSVSQAADATRDAVGQAADTTRQAMSQAADTTRQAANVVSREVRDNPVPYALIGIGLAWLIANNRRDRSHAEYGRTDWSDERLGSSSTLDSESAWGGAATAGEGSYDATGSYTGSSATGSSTLGEYGTGSYGTTRNYRGTSNFRTGRLSAIRPERVRSMLEENPMAFGIAALAAGALIGAAIPTSGIENEYLGEARDSVVDSAKTIAENTAQKLVDSPDRPVV